MSSIKLGCVYLSPEIVSFCSLIVYSNKLAFTSFFCCALFDSSAGEVVVLQRIRFTFSNIAVPDVVPVAIKNVPSLLSKAPTASKLPDMEFSLNYADDGIKAEFIYGTLGKKAELIVKKYLPKKVIKYAKRLVLIKKRMSIR